MAFSQRCLVLSLMILKFDPFHVSRAFQTLKLPPRLSLAHPLLPSNAHKISRNMSMSLEQTDGDNTIQVLCLHGKGNCGESFQKILAPLKEHLETATSMSYQFDCLSAPFPMQEEDFTKMQWWTLPPGVRSFNAKEYNGFDESSQIVVDAMRIKDYDFVLGHSQGSILLSALITSDSWSGRVHDFKKPIGYILNGCAWPNPYTAQMESFTCIEESDGVDIKPKALFIIGKEDKINPPEGAEKVRDVFKKGGLEVDSVYHQGGHAVPVKDTDVVEEIVGWISRTLATTA